MDIWQLVCTTNYGDACYLSTERNKTHCPIAGLKWTPNRNKAYCSDAPKRYIAKCLEHDSKWVNSRNIPPFISRLITYSYEPFTYLPFWDIQVPWNQRKMMSFCAFLRPEIHWISLRWTLGSAGLNSPKLTNCPWIGQNNPEIKSTMLKYNIQESTKHDITYESSIPIINFQVQTISFRVSCDKFLAFTLQTFPGPIFQLQKKTMPFSSHCLDVPGS